MKTMNWFGVLVCAAVLAGCASPGSRSVVDNGAIAAVFDDVDRDDGPGCAVGVYARQTLVYATGFGLADLEHRVPITSSTVFDVGSVSKQFTAACIALLVADGDLDIDDDVRRYVPELPDYGDRITIRHLLYHRSGLRDYIPLMLYAGFQTADYTTVEQTLDIITRQRKLEFIPGERHRYSNTGYFLLSIVIERLTGESLAQFAQRRLFDPLGMSSTLYRTDHTAVIAGRAVGYTPDPIGGYRIAMSNWEQTGDGSVMTTVEDLGRWERNLTTGEVGGPRWRELMSSPGQLPSGEETDYGFGLRHETWRGLDTVRHGGAWVGYRAALLRFPEQQLAIAVLANSSAINAGEHARRVAEVLLGHELQPTVADDSPGPPKPAAASVEISPDRLSDLAGRYVCDELGVIYEVFVADGDLRVRVRGETSPPLTPVAQRTFEAWQARFEFAPRGEDSADGFRLTFGDTTLEFQRL